MNEGGKMPEFKGFLKHNQTVQLYGVIFIIDSAVWYIM